MVQELGRANDVLSKQYNTVGSLSELTQNLMQTLLQGGGLTAMANSASNFLKSEVIVVDIDGIPLASSAGCREAVILPSLLRELVNGIAVVNQAINARAVMDEEGYRWLAQPLLVEGEIVGWVAGKIGLSSVELTELTLAQVTMIAAVHRLEQRAASRARSETIDAIVWDLLRAGESGRAAALDRAADVKLDLSGPLRLFVCEIGPASGSPDRAVSAVRVQVVRVIHAAKSTGVRAIATNGLSLAIICTDDLLDEAERLAQRIARRLDKELGGRLVLIGGSSRCVHARGLQTAYREALISLDVARQLRRSTAVIYDRAGVVGMLLSLRHEAGMERFLELNFGELLKEEIASRETLLQTLRAYFDANCSLEAAAQRLGVHRKTVSARIAKISELTGLDFSTHDDRLIADLSLYVYALITNREYDGNLGLLEGSSCIHA